jgi:sigma-B regulation protein RsbU (phosphoserine phosphatase)
MAPRLLPPAPPRASSGGPLQRARAFLLHRWRGRVLLGSLVVWLLAAFGAPLPDPIVVLATILLCLFGAWGAFRIVRVVLRRLLFKIRTKLIVSYLFIAVVPVVLLVAFFMIAGIFFSGLVASYLVSSEVDRIGRDLEGIARSALATLPADARAAEAALARPLRAARAIHPDVSHALVRNGRTLTASGAAPRSLPSWWKGPGFAGLVEDSKGTLRAVWSEGQDTFLALDVPVDDRLFAALEARTGIQLLASGKHVEVSREGGGLQVRVDEGERRALSPPPEPATAPSAKPDADPDPDPDEPDVTLRSRRDFQGMPFVSTPEGIDWETGKTDPAPLAFVYQPWSLIRKLSPGTLNMGDVLVKALGAVGAVFMVMYSVAFVLGILLARSITRNIHGLSQGTERLRRGDFGQPIPIRSRDQLGELADSFNVMARGIQDLLREQAEKQRMEEELRIARQIQMSLLPAQGASLPGLRIAALCLPAAEVGGDYYDLLPLSDTRMGVVVADVSGKGTSAALYMAELKGLVLSLSRIYDSPARLLAEANRILSANMDSRSFVTMTYAIVDTEARSMRYARAGHNPMIQYEAGSGRTRVLAPQGLGLGIDRGERFEAVLEEAEVPLASGDLFLFFTDGLSEAMNPRAELFGEGRLREVLEKSEAMETEAVKENILAEVRAFVGEAAQHDDMTLVLFRVA